MLYYAIAMQRLFSLLAFALLSAGLFLPPKQAASPAVSITAPVGGQALQGVVAITGSIPAEGFQSAELSFGYAKDASGTWFLIQQIDQPVTDGTLAQWDTTAISDGDYNLLLTVTQQDGQKITARVNGVRVRNYTAIETNTPTIAPPTFTPLPSGTPTPTFTPEPSATPRPTDTPQLPTVTPLPTNPARLSRQSVVASLGQGALVGIGAISLLGVYAILRSLVRALIRRQ
jgi:hypothetical protein